MLAATLVLYAIQSAYSVDVSNAIENASFFLVPFAVLFVLLGEVRWSDRAARLVLVTVSRGRARLRRGRVLGVRGSRPPPQQAGTCSPSNQLHLYFRVNSLFYDPNILGRDLALVLVALGAYLAWARGTRGSRSRPRSSAGILLAALALSYSITGFVALIAGLLVVAGASLGAPVGRRSGGVVIVAAIAIFFAVSGVGRDRPELVRQDQRHLQRPGEPGRAAAITSPGTGPSGAGAPGSFGAAFKDTIDPTAKTTVSHSEPLTVGAEQGGHRPDRLRGAGCARA